MSQSRLLRHIAVAVTSLYIAMLAAGPVRAGSASGTIGVSLNVTAACVVNGATSVSSTFGNAGTIAFADQPGLFANVDAQVQAGVGGALSVLCSPGVSPSLTVGAGAHDASGQRYLAAGSSNVAYHLFADAARTSEILVGGAIPLGTASTAAISVPIYARVNSGGVVLPAGAYSDTVQVVLSW